MSTTPLPGVPPPATISGPVPFGAPTPSGTAPAVPPVPPPPPAPPAPPQTPATTGSTSTIGAAPGVTAPPLPPPPPPSPPASTPATAATVVAPVATPAPSTSSPATQQQSAVGRDNTNWPMVLVLLGVFVFGTIVVLCVYFSTKPTQIPHDPNLHAMVLAMQRSAATRATRS